jgi:hypothetical protein
MARRRRRAERWDAAERIAALLAGIAGPLARLIDAIRGVR